MNPSTPLRVGSVKITGNDRTSVSLIESELAQSFEGRTVQTVSESISHALERLESYGIFESAKITMDKGDILYDQSTNERIVTTDLHVDVKERNWWGAKTEVAQELHTGEQLVKMSGLLRNVFGKGEKFEVTSSRGTARSVSFSALLTMPKPFASNKQTFLSNVRSAIGANVTTHNYTRQASFCETVRGMTAALSDETGKHEMLYEFAWRDIVPVSKTLTDDEKRVNFYQGPSASIRQSAAVPTTKSSVKYSYTDSTLDNRFVPSQGRFIQSSAEVAGLGGDVQFGKLHVEAKQYFPIHPSVTFGLSCSMGAVRPFNQSINKSTHLSDRFFLGHALSVRGFAPFTLGPLDHEDNIGGDAMATASASLTFKLPVQALNDAGARLHLFANAGNLIDLNSHQSTKQSLRQAASDARVSFGAGLAIPSPLGRLEFNVVHAAQKQASDRTRSLQWGLGWQFA